MNKEFWKNWKNKTEIEKKAIKSISKARVNLFENISEDKIIAIYIKGSFVRREMNEKSDVDIVPIVKDNRTLVLVKELQKQKGDLYKPSELLPISIWELKHNERYIKNEMKGKPDQFLKQLSHAMLIYGKPLDISKFNVRDDKKELYGLVGAFNTLFIPKYESGEFGFSQVVKCVFWLTYLEYKIAGVNPPPPFQELNNFVKDKKHIIHQAMRLRLHRTKDKKIRRKFIINLKKYLTKLEIIIK